MLMLSDKIKTYITQHTSPEIGILAKLNKETNQRTPMPQMLAGHYQGMFLQMVSRALRPKTILEIGTYTGYSAICLAQGLQSGGQLFTIDMNETLKPMANRFIKQAGLNESITLLSGNALEIVPTLNKIYDLVYIDADKLNYSKYYDLIVDNVRPGGIILADNVLWSGAVVNTPEDKKTKAIDDFNKKVQADERVKNIILSIRDGVMWIERL